MQNLEHILGQAKVLRDALGGLKLDILQGMPVFDDTQAGCKIALELQMCSALVDSRCKAAERAELD